MNPKSTKTKQRSSRRSRAPMGSSETKKSGVVDLDCGSPWRVSPAGRVEHCALISVARKAHAGSSILDTFPLLGDCHDEPAQANVRKAHRLRLLAREI